MNNNFNEQLDKTLNIWGAPKETLVEIVEAYQNNELGANSNNSENNGSNNSTSNNGCDCTDKISSLQYQINELMLEINETTNKLNLLLNKLYDRSAIYNTTYDHIDPSILFRTYDFFERNTLISTTYNSSTYSIGLFCLNASNATIKLTLNIYAETADGTGQITFYVNGTSVDVRSLESITTQEQKYEFYFNVSLLDTGNRLETVVHTTGGNKINVSYIKYEAYNCTNPTFVQYDARYNVDYYDGKYYLSDCSGPTAKYAIVPTETFNSINDINWIDTGIEATSYRFLTQLVAEGGANYHNPNVSYFYIQKNNNLTLYDASFDKTYTEKQITHADPIQPRKDELIITANTINARNIATYFYIFKTGKSRSYAEISSTSKYCLVYGIKNYLTGITSILERTLYVAHNASNCLSFGYKNVFCDLGYGSFVSAYVENQNPLQVEVYTKVHDYVVKHKISYTTPTSTPKLDSYTSEVCGTYDKFFKGVKNDYFTVENGVWHYYQSDLLEG